MTQPIGTGLPLAGIKNGSTTEVVLEALNLSAAGGKTVHPVQDISLFIPPRSLVAVAGPAGSGKTTLLEILAAIRPPTSGQVLINGNKLYSYRKAFLPWIGYVSSRPSLHLTLTVAENIDSAARLRMPRGTSRQARRDRVDELVALLGLTNHRGTQVSLLDPFERYLTQMGTELVTGPTILLLDEPEQAIDPGAVAILLNVFRKLIASGMTILFVTQSTTAMQSADRLILLDRGGYLVWFGPPAEAPAFFANGESHDLPGAASNGFEAIFSHNQKPPKDWAAQYKAFPGYLKYVDDPISGKRRDLMLEDRPLSRMRGTESEPQPPPPVARSTAFSQFFALLLRNIRLMIRDHASLVLALVVPLLLAAGIMIVADPTMYSPVVGDATRINQVFAVLTILVILVSAFAFVRSISAEAAPLRRERQVSLRPVAYTLSKFSLVLPLAIYQSLVVTLAYTLAAKPPGGIPAGVGIFITLFLASLVGSMLGLLSSALGSSSQGAVVWVLLLVLPQLIYSGIFIPLHQQGMIGQGLSTVMPARYAFEGLVAASGYGNDVAQDTCWALPDSQRLALTDTNKQNCTCMGSNIFSKCSFPGIRGAITSALDQPQPVAPIPDTGMNELPVQPLLKPGESVNQYADEINQYTLQLETYQGIVSSYLSNLQQYLNAAIAWQKLQSYAIGSAESRIADQVNRYGPIYSVDLGSTWLVLLGTSLLLLLGVAVVQIGKGRA